MPGEVKINIGKIKASKAECLRTKHKEMLGEMKQLLGSISKFPSTNPDRELFSVLVKKFIFTTASVSDDYFLSDICEPVHELFIEFRLALGYFESNSTKKLQTSFEDVVTMCGDIYEAFRSFISDPGYLGTNFPKPGKLRAMRELANTVREAGDVVVLGKKDYKTSNAISSKRNGPITLNSKKKQPESHVAIDIFGHRAATQQQRSTVIESDDSCNRIEMITQSVNALSFLQGNDSSSSSSRNCSETSSLKSPFEAPQAPQLFSQEVSAIKSVTSVNPTSVMVAALNDLMAPPAPPSSNHGRIAYIDPLGRTSTVNRRSNPASRRGSRGSQTLKPPILVDDEGDILPSSGPQLKSAVASIYEASGGQIVADKSVDIFSVETPKGLTPKARGMSLLDDDDDSFIVAYREYAKGTIAGNVEKKEAATSVVDKSEFESSGWSLKNRT